MSVPEIIKKEITAFDLAQRFVGISGISGPISNPHVLAMLRLDEEEPEDDDVPWCSAFVNYIAWLLRLPRSKSLGARSWLQVGASVELDEAKVGFDVVVLKRGTGKQPGPDVIKAKGHVGFFAGREETHILVLGGNQANSVKVSRYPVEDVLGIRRIYA
jgi:uncharacterized protein (TIGR02594 family)